MLPYIHRRHLQGIGLLVIPVIVNTFASPNDPTPRRSLQPGRALRVPIDAYPEDLCVSVLVSYGLSHVAIDGKPGHDIIDAIPRSWPAWSERRASAGPTTRVS